MFFTPQFALDISAAEGAFGGFNLSVGAKEDREYLLESTRNFRDWTPIETITSGDIKRVPSNSAEFYRLVLIPN